MIAEWYDLRERNRAEVFIWVRADATSVLISWSEIHGLPDCGGHDVRDATCDVQRRIVLSTAAPIAFACLIGRTGPAAQAPRPAGGPTAIVGARLIDGTGAAPVDDSVVLVQGDRIRAAGARAGVQVPRDAEVVEAKGEVLTPGLVDVHCHMNQPPEDMKR